MEFRIDKKAKIINVVKSKYDFNGNSGVSVKANVLIDDDIVKMPFTKEYLEVCDPTTLDYDDNYEITILLLFKNNIWSIKIDDVRKVD